MFGVGTAVTSASSGGMSNLNEVIARVLALPIASVTVIVQSEYVVPSSSVLRVTVLLPAVAEVVELLQAPPYVMVPASSEVKV